jgi:hypothetical protein
MHVYIEGGGSRCGVEEVVGVVVGVVLQLLHATQHRH